jgi:hypothetical protein
MVLVLALAKQRASPGNVSLVLTLTVAYAAIQQLLCQAIMIYNLMAYYMLAAKPDSRIGTSHKGFAYFVGYAVAA